MPLTLIEGSYRILNSAPDGDSVRFYPDDPAAFSKAHLRVRTNQAGGAQLRLDGIDTLETHYQPQVAGFGMTHQPMKLARGAAGALLEFLGFQNVQRGPNETVTAATPAQVLGYILTRFSDKYGRCVAFAFKGSSPQADLSNAFLDVALFKQSANEHMLSSGFAYPTYYSKLFFDIRGAMTAAVDAARGAKAGLWPKDVSTKGFTVPDLKTLTDRVVIMPKLYRRLIDYLAINDGSVSLAGFSAYLATRDDRLFILSTGHATGFDFVVEVNGQNVRMTRPPEDLVFLEG